MGQGLAGTVLGFLLLEKGYDIKIIDDHHSTSSSVIAAGMWNPVSFKRMIESWRANQFLPTMHSVFSRMETVLGERFFHPLQLVRIFPDQHAANLWDQKSISAGLSSYLTDKQDKHISVYCRQPFGHGVVAGSGWLDVKKLLDASRNFFQSHDILVDRKFQYAAFDPKEEERKNVLTIFCTGAVNRENPYFGYLPLVPNKGQLLTIKFSEPALSSMVNFGRFLIPLGAGKFKLGSTYEFDQQDPDPTQEVRNEMLNDVKELMNRKPDVLEHTAGFRPTTIDRRPLLGLHRQWPRLAIFNGFGSKGVLLIPWCAAHFIEFLEGKAGLDAEMNIARFEKNRQ